jgi:hypothetical protein
MYLYDVCVYIYIRGVGGLREGGGEGWRRETGREREREREGPVCAWREAARMFSRTERHLHMRT